MLDPPVYAYYEQKAKIFLHSTALDGRYSQSNLDRFNIKVARDM